MADPTPRATAASAPDGWRHGSYPFIVWLLFFALFAVPALSAGMFNPRHPEFETRVFLTSFASILCAVMTTTLVIDAILARKPGTFALGLAATVGLMTLLLPIPFRANVGQYLLVDAAAVAIAVAAGSLLAALLRRVGYLLPLLVAASLVDIWSVFFGPTSQIARMPELLSHFVFYYPVLGSFKGVDWVIGIADLLFIAFLLAAGRRHGFDRRKLFLNIAVAVMVEMGCASYTPYGLPVIPFLTIFVVAGEWKKLVADRRNFQNAVVITAGVIAVLALALWLSTRA